ncbi:MAG: Ig-like domain repeat protein, partial [Candidatus Dormibacteria bacterium]
MALTSSLSPSVTGQGVTYTAKVTSAGGSPTGSVNFQDGATSVSGCAAVALAAGTATCTTAPATAGAHSITALYSGDANFSANTSPALVQTVNLASTTTVLSTSLTPSVTGQGLTYTATIAVTAPGAGAFTGSVNFQDGGTTIGGCGAATITAGKATCATAPGTVGAHAITAVYSGDANFATSTAATLTQTVNKATTTTAVVTSVTPAVTGQAVTYTATIVVGAPGAGAPTGTINFLDGATSVPGCSAVVVASGTAACALSAAGVGSHAITAVYSGDANFATSTSAVVTEVVNQAPTTATVTSSVNPSVVGQGVTYTVAVKANAPGGGTPTGTANFLDGATSVPGCSAVALSAGSATCAATYPVVGSHTITVVYSGDPNYTTATSSALAQTVNAAASATTVSSSANPSLPGQPVTYTANVTSAGGSPTGSVAFKDGATTITGCSAVALAAGAATCAQTYTGVGGHTITAVYSGDANFAASTSSALTQTVGIASTTTALSSSANPAVAGQAVTYTATVAPVAPAAGNPTGSINFQDGAISVAGCATVALAPAGPVSTASCTVTYPGVGAHT